MLKKVEKMETKEVKCDKCGKSIFILEEHIRDKMFCTLGCMDSYNNMGEKRQR